MVMSNLSTSTPDEVKEIAEKASEISKEASKQTQESVYRHEKQAKEYAREKLVSESMFIVGLVRKA